MTAQTCFHGRHIGPILLDGLNGDNWRLADYEKREGHAFIDMWTASAGVIVEF